MLGTKGSSETDVQVIKHNDNEHCIIAGLWFGLVLNAYEKAHKAYGWLSMSDVRLSCMGGCVLGVPRNRGRPGVANPKSGKSTMDKMLCCL